MALNAEQPGDLASLLELLRKEAELRRKKAHSLQQLIFGLAGGYVGVAFILFIIKRELELSSILTFTSLFACLAAGVSMTSQHRQALSQAAQWQDPRVIPHLVEALDADLEEIRQEAKSALKALLPKAESAGGGGIILTPKQRKLLADLCRDKDPELAGQAIIALGSLGDESSLKTLDEIGRGAPKTPQPHQQKVSALALESAGNLRLRLARQIVEERTSGGKLRQESSDKAAT